MTEQEEFEFRHRLEQEQGQAQGQQPPQGTTLNRIAGKISSAMQFINNPSGQDMSNVNLMEPQGQNLFNRAGEATAEYLGGKNLLGNPYTAAAVGTGVSMLNPQNWMAPPAEGALNKTFLKPVVPAGRQAAVQAAREASVPLTRAEMTGGKFITGLENITEKTPLGSGPMGETRGMSDAAMEAYKARLQGQMGTAKENFDVGYQAKPAVEARGAAMNKTRGEKFEAVPTDPHIPLNESIDVADQILQEQSQYLPTTRNGDVIAIAKDVQNAHRGISAGEGVTGGPDAYGYTYKTPDETIPGKNVVTEHQAEPSPNVSYSRNDAGELIANENTPAHYTVEATPGKTIPGKDVFAAGYKVGPEAKFQPKSNYQLLKRLRETLDGKAQVARDSGNFSAERDYLRLKSSVDKDINTYVETSGDQAFSSSYKQANAFSGAYKQLFKGDLAAKIESAPPEKILGMVFQKNNETAIKQFRALVGDEAFQQVKRKWVNDLLESPNVSQSLSEKKIDPGTLNAILTKPEQEAVSKYGLVQGLRKTVGSLQGTQGSARMTAHALSYGAILDALGAAGRGHFAEAAAAGTAFLGPYPLAKALTSRAATEGINVVIPEALRNASRKSVIAAYVNSREKKRSK